MRRVRGRAPGGSLGVFGDERARCTVAQWVDGLLHHERITDLLSRRDDVFVAHGHAHRTCERHAGERRLAQILGAAAVVDQPSPVRLYRTVASGIAPIAACPRVVPVPRAGVVA